MSGRQTYRHRQPDEGRVHFLQHSVVPTIERHPPPDPRSCESRRVRNRHFAGPG
ncbi:hypothetical protein C4K39_2333 [Pseudomonas sessilinigenes]|nr:hypothetical protein C4K39_2333 [Pseudomonas sessilinigenes]